MRSDPDTVHAHPRFTCPARTPVTAAALVPGRLGAWLLATVVEIGAGGARLRIRVDPPDAGSILTLAVTVPYVGTHEVAGTVRRVVEVPGGAVLDVDWAPAAEFLAAVAEYLLIVDAGLTPKRLRGAGLRARAVDRAVRFGTAGPGELAAILDLRLRAHQSEGRLAGMTADDLASPFDAHARHLVCRHHGRIVACVRLLLVDGDPARSQYVSWGGHELPQHIWAAGFTEGGAGAVDPGYQRAGLFTPLMQHALRVTVANGHRFLVGACDDDLLGMYGAAGYSVLESRWVQPRPGWSFRSHLIHLDVEELLAGRVEGRAVPGMQEAARLGMAERDLQERQVG